MPGLDQLDGSTFGPFPVTATRERSDAFLSAIGGDASQDPTMVHPMFANAALFAVAPALLDDERVRPFTTSLLHSEQSFAWHAPLPVPSAVEVTGTVESVRARGPLNFVTFSVAATVGGEPWVDGTSVFLLSESAAASADDVAEPDEDERPPFDALLDQADLPSPGAALPAVACGASRVDLMRYAAASGDWNPIHYDHDAARRAGLGGVIVHGLLMAAWMGRVAARYGSLSAMTLRFRNPLRPAVPALVTGVVASDGPGTAELDLALEGDEVRLVTGRVTVTR